MSNKPKTKQCPYPGCDRLIDDRAEFCKKHRAITPEMLAAQQAGKEKVGRKRVNRICENCGKEFDTPISEVNKGGGKYCCKECRYEHMRGSNSPGWRGGGVIVKCFVCGKEKAVKVSNLPTREHFFCSYTCNSIHNMKSQHKKDTDIELIFRQALDNMGIEYESQKPFGKLCLADFFLPHYNTVVFCDGRYWHSTPERIAIDKHQTRRLKELGFAVYRFDDQQIKRDVKKCIESITELALSPNLQNVVK